VRARLVDAAHHGTYGRTIALEAGKPDYETMLLFDDPMPPYVSVAEVAAARGVDPVELILDLALASDFDQLFLHPLAAVDPAETLRIMKHPDTVMTFSDSGAHVSQIADSSLQTHLLAYWTRQREAFTLEEAVRMLTSVPATAWGFAGRGRVAEGCIADLNVFDPERVGPVLPSVEHDLPGGATRLMQRATGLLATVVGGRIAFRDGAHTGVHAGRLIRGPLTPSPLSGPAVGG
jgi:N-acyl-D-aspartate/D-glutamate deacylase